MSINPSGALPVLVFIVILLGELPSARARSYPALSLPLTRASAPPPPPAYTAQTELAQYVQQTLGYRQPFFLFWLTHSGYILLLPLHLLLASLTPGQPSLSSSLSVLRGVLAAHYAHSRSARDADPSQLDRSLTRGALPEVGGGRPRPRGRRMSMRRLLSRTGMKGLEKGEENRWMWNLGMVSLRLSVLIAIPSCTWYIATPL